MALVNLKQMLNKAYKGKYAVLHVNVINYDMALTAIKAANETNSPIIIAVSQKALKGFAGTKDFSQMIEQIVKFENIKTSVAIHLDHGEYQTVMEAMKNGFTSVMYDGSKLPLQQNLKNIKIIVAYARKHNISVEGEVGTVPGKVEDRGASGQLANVLECQRLAATGIDALAAGIGNLHGNYPSN
jgi:fructose-bisphosphate aldolase class II